jgi:2',3'-cyclic-nucleotide 2'-phosphodiesterase (5'-nucleotidase family)
MLRRCFLLLWLAYVLTTLSIYGQRRDIHILSANDMHATIQAFPKLAAIADSLREIDPELLVFSAGDNRTGNPINDKHEISGYPMVALMNQVGFNGSALGNHEFDMCSLARLTDLSTFRYICANMTAEPETGIHAVPCQVFDVKGLKVGVVGAIQLSPEGIPSTHPSNLKGLHFQPASEVLPQYEWMRRECDVVILLSHLGYEDDCAMADAFPWLDLIIGGHTHTQLKDDEIRNGVLITQNKNKLSRVTHITLTVDDGRVVSKHAEYINVKSFPRKNKIVEEMVRFFSNNPAFRRVIARAETPFEVREELGCMLCDALMDICHADVAVHNPGGVRIDSLSSRDITIHDVLEMDPFNNQAVILELTGNEMVQMMLSYCHHNLSSFPYVGGMRCLLKTDKKNPRLVRSVKLLTPEGKKMDMKRKYRVATNNYVPATSKIPDGSSHDLGMLTTDIIIQYLKKQQTVNYQGVRRLEVKSKKSKK